MGGSANRPAGCDEIRGLLRRIRDARVCVFGDFCLDAYWVVEPDESELSVETGLPVRLVREQRYSLGGAGNVLANLAAIGVGRLHCVGLVGDDLFGRELRRLIDRLNVSSAGLLSPPGWQTSVYGKPHRDGREERRLDFGSFNELSPASVEELADRLAAVSADCDAVIVNQQLPGGAVTAVMIERINAIIAKLPRTRFIVDSRHRAEQFRGAVLKLNSHEAARVGCATPSFPAPRVEGQGEGPAKPEWLVSSPACHAADGRAAGSPLSAAQNATELAGRLLRQTGQPVFVTCGGDGIVVADASGVSHAAGVAVSGPIDTVGAGDTVVAAVAAALAAGAGPLAAAELANLAASVTIRKLGVTGTATPEEILTAAGIV